MNLFSMWNRKGGILRDNSIVFVMKVSGVQYKIKQQWFSMDGWIDGWKKILFHRSQNNHKGLEQHEVKWQIFLFCGNFLFKTPYREAKKGEGWIKNTQAVLPNG